MRQMRSQSVVGDLRAADRPVDAGVGAEQVDRPAALQLGDERRQLRLRADVDRRAGGADLGRDGLHALGVEVRDDDLGRALGDERLGEPAADAARPAGDDRAAAPELHAATLGERSRAGRGRAGRAL